MKSLLISAEDAFRRNYSLWEANGSGSSPPSLLVYYVGRYTLGYGVKTATSCVDGPYGL